ncbi:hypothetical protein ACOSQ3_023984 [Xanthoceras sorbifolium]
MVSLQQLEQGVKPFQTYYNSLRYSKQISLPQGGISSNTVHYRTLVSKQISKAEAKELAAKKHSEAERRRRLRINGQYSALRTILPNLVKMDKASVLAETIKSLRELQKSVKELKAVCQGHKVYVFPSEADELNLRYSDNMGLLKATLSCEDKPGLISDLTRAVRSVKGRVVKAEMVTVGGRTKFVLWVQALKGDEGMMMLKRALNLVIDRPVLPAKGKKLRFYQ